MSEFWGTFNEKCPQILGYKILMSSVLLYLLYFLDDGDGK